jgi:iron complex transport system substrate-binding protein
MCRWTLAGCGALLLIVCTDYAGAVTVRDDSGQTIELAHPARRVVTLAPNLTELVFDLGAGERVLATVQFSNYPDAAKRIPRIGSSGSLNLEAMLAYRPDLVLAWRSGNNPQQIETIERLGIPVYRSEPQRLQDIAVTLEKLGRLLGRETQGEALARQLRQGIAQLRNHYAGRPMLSGFYQIWEQPLYTVNGRHIISDVMRLCGIRNVFADDPVLAPVVSLESVIARNPQMIISGGSGGSAAHALAKWRDWPSLTAVRAHNLFHIDADLMQRDTPRILEGARRLCQQAQLARQHLAGE